ncbi:beta-ketoacyl-[acyl-carrier-protein] synthase family protein [Tengunoibacter tsumagoiensis]|nr:beta-ketoacyl-[acyl-carrier-protein] synthase family protein [Tengunoibacter tsumagoiensis]
MTEHVLSVDDRRRQPKRRVVISGLGVIAPNGQGKEAFWQACLAGQSGVGRITRFDAGHLPSQVAGEVSDFDPLQYGLTTAEITHLDRAAQFALAASELALQDSGLSGRLTSAEREQMGVYLGTALSCLEAGEHVWERLTNRGTQEPTLDPSFHLPASLLLAHAGASSIAAHYALYGPCLVLATGCSAGADALGEAFWTIQEGRAERMLAGGTDAAICYGVLDVFCVMGALSTHFNDQPTQASRPYDRLRDGFVMAEGAAVLLLEEREQALERGAHIYAEILAFASNSNAHHMTSLPEAGQPLQALIRAITSTSNLSPRAIEYINSHGSSTPTNERAETLAYKAIFGECASTIPISATKSLIGHTQGAASAIETLITAMALERQIIPPTINQEVSDPCCDLDYVPNVAREANISVALTHSSGFGGVNSALLLARADWGQL